MRNISILTRNLLALASFAIFTTSLNAEVEVYNIDPNHSSVGFKIRHFFSQVPGSFTEFSGTITVDKENPENNKTEAVIKVTSVDTNNEKRDKHLLGDDFFSAPDFPQITFKSTKWEKTGEDKFTVTGDLTIKDITKKVTLDVSLLGFGENHRGKQLSGWSATTTLNKQDFGITYGSGILGDEVAVEINIEAVRQ